MYIKYQKKLQVEEKEAGEVIDIIYEKLKEILNQSFSQVENLLIGLSALYGHTIIWGNKGEWNWDETVPVLFEEEKGGLWRGHTPQYMAVQVEARGQDLHNQIRAVRLTALSEDRVLGTLDGKEGL